MKRIHNSARDLPFSAVTPIDKHFAQFCPKKGYISFEVECMFEFECFNSLMSPRMRIKRQGWEFLIMLALQICSAKITQNTV